MEREKGMSGHAQPVRATSILIKYNISVQIRNDANGQNIASLFPTS
jgi:hypothetical protein